MIAKKHLLSLITLFLSSQTFSMAITAGEIYRDKRNGRKLSVVESCKKVWGIESLISSGDQIRNPAILCYFTECVKTSEREQLLSLFSKYVAAGNQKAIEACLNPEYHGEFYYAKCGLLGECVHPSWLEAITKPSPVETTSESSDLSHSESNSSDEEFATSEVENIEKNK